MLLERIRTTLWWENKHQLSSGSSVDQQWCKLRRGLYNFFFEIVNLKVNSCYSKIEKNENKKRKNQKNKFLQLKNFLIRKFKY